MEPNIQILKRVAGGTKLKAAINVGNAVLAYKDMTSGKVMGISVDIVERLARDLGLEVELYEKDVASKSVAAVAAGDVDLGFFAIDPARDDSILFTPPYVLIEGCYLVAEGSPIVNVDQVDVPGVRIVVGRGSAYDLFLTRHITEAEIIRVARSQDVVEYFMRQDCDVAAGVRQQLEKDRLPFHGLRMLDEPFMTIRQAVAVNERCGTEVLNALSSYLDLLKVENFIAESADRHGIDGITITEKVQELYS